MNSTQIANCLAETVFNYRRNIIVPNVSWGMLPWEADLLIVTASNYLYEVEIKVTIADLKRDSKKKKWIYMEQIGANYHNAIRAMWYAMPLKVWEHRDAGSAVSEHAGVVVVDPENQLRFQRAQIVRHCRPNKQARKVTDAEKLKMSRLGLMRYWSSRNKEVASQPASVCNLHNPAPSGHEPSTE